MEVSVICPIYNTEPEQLVVAVNSVLCQIGSHFIDLILIDDNSSNPITIDCLTDILNKHSQISLLKLSKNGGPSVARQAGLCAAKYSWISFIDADDIWPPDKLNKAMLAITLRPDTRWILGNYATILDNEENKKSIHISIGLKSENCLGGVVRLTYPELTSKLVGDWLPLGTSVISKSLIEIAGGFDKRLRYGEDWLLFLKLSTHSPADYIESETYLLRRQGVSMMRSYGRMSMAFLKAVRLARKDPSLKIINRELRWKEYRDYKDVAMNNAINGRKMKGVFFALRAWISDPREFREFLFYLRALFIRPSEMANRMRRYSTSEQVNLSAFTIDR